MFFPPSDILGAPNTKPTITSIEIGDDFPHDKLDNMMEDLHENLPELTSIVFINFKKGLQNFVFDPKKNLKLTLVTNLTIIGGSFINTENHLISKIFPNLISLTIKGVHDMTCIALKGLIHLIELTVFSPSDNFYQGFDTVTFPALEDLNVARGRMIKDYLFSEHCPKLERLRIKYIEGMTCKALEGLDQLTDLEVDLMHANFFFRNMGDAIVELKALTHIVVFETLYKFAKTDRKLHAPNLSKFTANRKPDNTAYFKDLVI